MDFQALSIEAGLEARDRCAAHDAARRLGLVSPGVQREDLVQVGRPRIVLGTLVVPPCPNVLFALIAEWAAAMRCLPSEAWPIALHHIGNVVRRKTRGRIYHRYQPNGW